MIVVVGGPAGTGKSSVAAAVAARLGYPFFEGDGFHPEANIARMRAGLPLDDVLRQPWLEALSAAITEWHAGRRDVVLTCSALRRRYRDRLRAAAPGIVIVMLTVPRDVLVSRVAARPGHFFPATLVDTQLEQLEPPDAGEGVAVVAADRPLVAVVDDAVAAVQARAPGHRPGEGVGASPNRPPGDRGDAAR